MNIENMRKMGSEELEAYAKSLGFTLAAADGVEAKVSLIEKRRSRSVSLSVLGVPLEVEVRRAHDSRFFDVINDPARTRADLMGAFKRLLGDGQWAELVAACTDSDGTVDEDALAFAMDRLLSCEELKNF